MLVLPINPMIRKGLKKRSLAPRNEGNIKISRQKSITPHHPNDQTSLKRKKRNFEE